MFNKSRLFPFYYKEQTNTRHFQEVSNRTKYYILPSQQNKESLAVRENVGGSKRKFV